jgi:hypothetical protein
VRKTRAHTGACQAYLVLYRGDVDFHLVPDEFSSQRRNLANVEPLMIVMVTLPAFPSPMYPGVVCHNCRTIYVSVAAPGFLVLFSQFWVVLLGPGSKFKPYGIYKF